MADINSGLVPITFLQHQHLIRTTFTLRPSGVVYSVPCTSYLWHPSWLHVYMVTLLAPYAFFLGIRFTIFFPASSSILSDTAKDFHIAMKTVYRPSMYRYFVDSGILRLADGTTCVCSIRYFIDSGILRLADGTTCVCSIRYFIDSGILRLADGTTCVCSISMKPGLKSVLAAPQLALSSITS